MKIKKRKVTTISKTILKPKNVARPFRSPGLALKPLALYS